MAQKTPVDPIDEREVDGDSGEGGKSGKGGKGGKSGKAGRIYIPGFDDLIAVSPEEAELAACAKDALFAQRVSLKSQGHKVSALDKKLELRKKLDNPGIGAELNAGGGSNLEKHPELPEMAGVFDDVVFPESEVEAAASNDPDLALRNQLKARLGMGVSMQTLREELRKEEKLRARPNFAPDPKPEYVIRPAAPPPRPRPF